MLFDIDDTHCIGSVRMLFDYYGIDGSVITGTHSPQKAGGWAPFGNEVDALDIAFPLGQCVVGQCTGTSMDVGWVNAHEDWGHDASAPLIAEIGAFWMSVLNGGGKIWIMEGGMGDFTLTVAKWIQVNAPGLDLKNIHSIQHSNWNINNSGPGKWLSLSSSSHI